MTQVTINVLDENDNAPKLVRDTFDVTLPENTPVGTTLISVVASDPDQDENGMISFTIISGDTDSEFAFFTSLGSYTAIHSCKHLSFSLSLYCSLFFTQCSCWKG